MSRWQRAGGGSYDPRAQLQGSTRFGGAASSAAARDYKTMTEARERAAYLANAKAKSSRSRGYFDDDGLEDEDEEEDELLRECGSGGGDGGGDDDGSIDPLDAFMAGVDSTLTAAPAT